MWQGDAVGFMSDRPGLNNSQLLASYLSPGKFLNLLEPLFSHLHNSGENCPLPGVVGKRREEPISMELSKEEMSAHSIRGSGR